MQKDNVNPAHYKQGAMQTIDVMKAKLTTEEFRGHLKGCILKYVTREKLKNGIEDLEKAQWYLDYLIAFDTNQPFKSHAEIQELLTQQDVLEAGLQDMQNRLTREMGLQDMQYKLMQDGGLEDMKSHLIKEAGLQDLKNRLTREASSENE
ncbi:TPA_asm: DUF3310 domain-containing protein [Listeria monocytogenes]|nr:DUF3310 domain-containing protein [Listeria monocytogenes]